MARIFKFGRKPLIDEDGKTEDAYMDGFDDGFDAAQIIVMDRSWIFDLCQAVAYVVRDKHATDEEVAYMVNLNYNLLLERKKAGIDLDSELYGVCEHD